MLKLDCTESFIKFIRTKNSINKKYKIKKKLEVRYGISKCLKNYAIRVFFVQKHFSHIGRRQACFHVILNFEMSSVTSLNLMGNEKSKLEMHVFGKNGVSGNCEILDNKTNESPSKILTL